MLRMCYLFLTDFYLGFPHADKVIVIDIIGEKAFLLQVWNSGLHHLVEDMVGPLNLLIYVVLCIFGRRYGRTSLPPSICSIMYIW